MIVQRSQSMRTVGLVNNILGRAPSSGKLWYSQLPTLSDSMS